MSFFSKQIHVISHRWKYPSSWFKHSIFVVGLSYHLLPICSCVIYHLWVRGSLGEYGSFSVNFTWFLISELVLFYSLYCLWCFLFTPHFAKSVEFAECCSVDICLITDLNENEKGVPASQQSHTAVEAGGEFENCLRFGTCTSCFWANIHFLVHASSYNFLKISYKHQANL